MFTSRVPAQRQGITPIPCMSPSPRKFHLPPFIFHHPHSSSSRGICRRARSCSIATQLRGGEPEP